MTADDVRRAAGTEISQLETHLAKTVEGQRKHKAAAAAAEENQKLIEAADKRVAGMHAHINPLQVDARPSQPEAEVKAALAKLRPSARRRGAAPG